ncbi:MAG: helix-turn-helix domain-containing protein [Prevotella sp.]|nr:helix-turn-helix domain-containing protein [Prevotella sp.]
MAKKDIELLEKRIEFLEKRTELLEMQLKELKTVEPDIINERFKSIEDALYSTKDILNMKDVCQYLDISQSLLYKLTCNGEIPHFKPRGKTIFFEKQELIKWIKNNGNHTTGNISEPNSQGLNDSCDNEKEDS